jgi:phage FluMu protein Com
MNSPEKPTASLSWSLDVDCPACNESNDLASGDHDYDHEIVGRIFSNQWDSLAGWEVRCEHCGHEFEIDKVEY